ncbi:MAG: polysaccharide deacetylase family protein [Desulfobacterota bacterium]|nr:polysaccharide deacetylase family protein [Thermodesulfobacteriota bacterium]
MERIIGLKIDVDTYLGMREGVPKILSILKTYNIRGSFFVPMGYDNTGRAIRRVFTRRGFLSKVKRIGVVKTYGIKTLLYGVFLPGPKIAEKNVGILKRILTDGHELGIHGYDHVFWHDRIKKLGYERTKIEIDKAVETFTRLSGQKPKSFASPGWMVNVHALKILKDYGFSYSSDTRGRNPFYPVMGGEFIPILQIPTTLPTLDEIVGIYGSDELSLFAHYKNLLSFFNVLTIHAEIEGNNWANFLKIFFERTLESGYRFLALTEIAENVDHLSVPQHEIIYGVVGGRAGEVCIQGPKIEGSES